MDIFARLVEERGFGAEFLKPKYENLVDPFLLPNMKEAVERIKKAVENGEKVLIYGDYDVDGVTASTVMYDTLKLAGVKEVEVMLPDRFRDGYGMSGEVVKGAKKEGFSLVVTVDCGSRNNEIIEKLTEVGVDTVVTDHHECAGDLPECPVVNPKVLSAEPSSEKKLRNLRDLAGVGVAFEVARALMGEGLIPEGQEKWLLDLVLIGTICDAMRLSQENRILTYWGKRVILKTRRPGLVELMRVAKITEINAEAIGFRIGPRLNAAGRMKSAELALKLLMTKSRTEAARLAEELDLLNNERRSTQIAAVKEIGERELTDEPVMVVTGEWHEGVLGIIAGKLVEEYRKPAFVLSKIDEVYKGSGRSFGEFNLAEALKACENCIVGGGGHAEACGVKVAEGDLTKFCKAVNDYYRELELCEQEKFLEEKEDLTITELKGFSLEMMEKMAELEPFGAGNKEPLFLLEEVFILEVKKMGAEGQHLALMVRGDDGGTMKLMAFFAPEEWMKVEGGMRANIWMRASVNEFRGLKNVEGRIERLKIVL